MFESVRARLTLWYLGILAIVLIVFSGISYALLDRSIRSAFDASLAGTTSEVAAAFAREGSVDVRFSDRDIFIFDSSGRVVAAAASILTPAERTRVAQVATAGTGPMTVTGGHENDGIRIDREPSVWRGHRFTIVVAQDLDPQADRLEAAAAAVGVGIPLALAVAAYGGYVLARKSLAPVTAMSAKARQISADTLNDRIAIANERDELGFLAATLNDLLARLQRAFESQRRFMADASHELRTPLSIIQGEADVALSRAERSADEYRESMETVQKAARRLTRIVQDLFLLARTDAGPYPMQKSRFYLDEMLAEGVRAFRTIAASKNIAIACKAPPDVVMSGDEELLQRMISNVIDNAVKFTPQGGRISIVASRADGVEIRITDSGPGIAAEERESVFERFYRGDPARRAAHLGTSSGAGLGLPIARWIAVAHGGTLELDPQLAPTTFTVRLPSTALADDVAGTAHRSGAVVESDAQNGRRDLQEREAYERLGGK